MNHTGYTEVIPVSRPLNKYEFTYYGFIPGYNDFDQEFVTIEAYSIEEAVNILSNKNIYAKHEPTLFSINDTPIDKVIL